MTLKILHSKTDQFRKGDEVIIARTWNTTCPLGMLKQYMMRTTQMQWQDDRFLFRPICKLNHGKGLREWEISYTCLRDLFKKKLSKLGYNLDDHGLHSLQAGGATKAANEGVADHLFKRYGRWKSKNAKDGYIGDSLEQKITVTQNLGL